MEKVISLCHWKCHRVLFHLEWHVLALVVRFVASGHLFFFFFSLLSPKNYSLTLFVVGILTSVLVLLIFIFCSWLFYKSFIYFQFHPSVSICSILFVSNLIHILLISNFFSPFVNVVVVFNFILQSKLMVLCFPIWFSLFWFLIFF